MERVGDFTGASVTQEPTGNALKAKLKLEVDARISNGKFTGASATQWYVFAGPNDAAVIVGFLEGRQAPTVEFFGLDSATNTPGVSWRVYHDFGAALVDPKAAQKSNGS